MTEKQFYIDTIDGGGSVLTVNGVELGLHETCDLLNELHEENMMLKGEVAHYKLILMSLEEEAKRLSQIR